ncbi:pyridoxine 5'-phosphate synthase [Candidatus Methylacidithermus pantelleriae]|uniref:Pyridoxine 5'-phosphate synthase n=1 Tax=Candidatus Methylacidithermus pantelleriae TaxID=2744239 RepID=A0A8J2BR41_9BACT|nr:pyridoxine 5'-phosphate synthase [Candidatus Methylacidithermus pantelleriae]CAF0700614.1 pyridoxine 5\\'-phosphate synthase [Candidatus Methylacidithermus pantelleriae]
MASVELGFNVDHVATLRQARYRLDPFSPLAEPDPLAAALIAEEAGASQITAHVREDRRHIQEEDARRIRQAIRTRFNLEMAPTTEMIEVAKRIQPHEACLVPERREEVTTEGGLDVASQADWVGQVIQELKKMGVRVSVFIDPEEIQVKAAASVGADAVELHTGAYALAREGATAAKELARHRQASEKAVTLGLSVHAGHGLHYRNVRRYLREVPHVTVVNIGHSIVARALLYGLGAAIREMVQLLEKEPVEDPRTGD